MSLATSTDGSISGQTNTQSPQTAGQTSIGGTRSEGVQPGTAASVLTSPYGQPLNPTPVTTVNLNPSAPTAQTITATPKPAPQRHVNTALLAFPIVLLLAAVLMFWAARRSVKSTTD